MNILDRIIIWINVIKDYLLSFPASRARILSAEETIEYIKKNHKSLIRYGDGEFKILNGQDVHYQQYNQELHVELEKIICEYQEESPYLLCMPHKYFGNNNFVLNSRVLISCWGKPKRMFQKYAKQDVVYGDAFIFAKNNKEIYHNLWNNYSNIILVHNDEKYLHSASGLEGQKGYYVKVPNCNSYGEIDNIEKEIITIYEDNDLMKENTVILVSAGPMAKALVFRLAENGYFAIDCGHIWDDPLEV